jgi:hypothetical protein
MPRSVEVRIDADAFARHVADVRTSVLPPPVIPDPTVADVRTTQEARALIQPTSCPTCLHREQRILERGRRIRRQRRRWVGRLVVAVLVVVLGVLAWYRFGDSSALVSVQR